MSLTAECRAFCRTHGLFHCQTIVVGVSGGADSVCLLHVLHTLSEEAGSEDGAEDGAAFPVLVAAHVNHGLRGDAADRDEEHVRSLCESLHIRLAVKKADVAAVSGEKKISLEEAGRWVRYSFFKETADACTADGQTAYIAVAHHREDQAETILMNLFRGTGPDGLCGMRPKYRGVIRPLLFASKSDITEYLRIHFLEYSEDASNQVNHFTRNRWRNQILPLIADVSRKDPVLPLLQTAEIVSDDRDYFESRVQEIVRCNAVAGGSDARGIPCEVLRREHRAISSRIIRFLYAEKFSSGTDLSYAHVVSILSLTEAGPGGRRIALPHGRLAYVSGDVLFFEDLTDLHRGRPGTWMTKTGPLLLSGSVDMPETALPACPGRRSVMDKNSKTSFQVETIFVENPMQVVYNSRTWYCTCDKLQGAVIRTRRKDDWFSAAGSAGGKPLRRFLTDRKIPAFTRDRILLAAKDSQVLWIPGIGHAEGFADEISRRRFDESQVQNAGEGYGSADQKLCRITIYDINDQEEQ